MIELVQKKSAGIVVFVIQLVSFRSRMDEKWKLSRLVGVFVVCLLCQDLSLSWCLNDEGKSFSVHLVPSSPLPFLLRKVEEK